MNEKLSELKEESFRLSVLEQDYYVQILSDILHNKETIENIRKFLGNPESISEVLNKIDEVLTYSERQVKALEQIASIHKQEANTREHFFINLTEGEFACLLPVLKKWGVIRSIRGFVRAYTDMKPENVEQLIYLYENDIDYKKTLRIKCCIEEMELLENKRISKQYRGKKFTTIAEVVNNYTKNDEFNKDFVFSINKN